MDTTEDPNTNTAFTESDTQKMVALIKEQNKEIKINKKKLEKLEEKFIKANADLKNIANDKTNIENFMRNIFPKEIHENVIKTDYGSYDSAELSKWWLVCESKNHNEFQQILQKYKNEINELNEKNKSIAKDLEGKVNELASIKKTNDQVNFYMNANTEANKKLENLEIEKAYLIKVIDEKNAEIENLISLEIENAELKAKTLLENLDGTCNSNNGMVSSSSCTLNPCGSSMMERKKQTEEGMTVSVSPGVKIVSLNAGSQTTETVYTLDHVSSLENTIENLKQKLERSRKEFCEYKEKSHKILISNEENYNKILKDHEMLKKELSNLLNATSAANANSQDSFRSIAIETNPNMNMNMTSSASLSLQIVSRRNSGSKNQSSKNLHRESSGSAGSKGTTDEEFVQKIGNEYLKNVLLKYLEAIAIGNEFQIHLLENVIFTILNVSSSEKLKLEEKRLHSSFYYNLWYNAKAFLSARIYGVSNSNQQSISDDSSTHIISNFNPSIILNKTTDGNLDMESEKISMSILNTKKSPEQVSEKMSKEKMYNEI